MATEFVLPILVDAGKILPTELTGPVETFIDLYHTTELLTPSNSKDHFRIQDERVAKVTFVYYPKDTDAADANKTPKKKGKSDEDESPKKPKGDPVKYMTLTLPTGIYDLFDSPMFQNISAPEEEDSKDQMSDEEFQAELVNYTKRVLKVMEKKESFDALNAQPAADGEQKVLLDIDEDDLRKLNRNLKRLQEVFNGESVDKRISYTSFFRWLDTQSGMSAAEVEKVRQEMIAGLKTVFHLQK